MEKRDIAATFFLLGLICGMVVAFASCSAATPDEYNRHQQPQQTGLVSTNR